LDTRTVRPAVTGLAAGAVAAAHGETGGAGADLGAIAAIAIDPARTSRT
jgi:hypothetical protein